LRQKAEGVGTEEPHAIVHTRPCNYIGFLNRKQDLLPYRDRIDVFEEIGIV
jgi:hypothetical protein